MKQSDLERQFLQALELLLKAEFSRALALFERLNAEVPREPRLVYGRALCLFMMGRTEEARTLCGRLESELKDPRGARLLDAFAGMGKAPVNPPPKEPVVRRRRRWPWVAAVAVLLLFNIGIWLAYPILLRLQMEGGQLPSLADAPRAALVTPNTAPAETVESPGGAATEKTDKDTTALATQLAQIAQSLAPSSSPTPSEPVTVPDDTPAWKARLEGLTLPEPTRDPVPSVVELQPYRTSESLSNDRGDSITLINLNPLVGSWYVLEYTVGGKKEAFHLEVFPLAANGHERPQLALWTDGLAVVLKNETQYFALWARPGGEEGELSRAADNAEKRLNPEPVLSEVFKSIGAARSPVGLICGNMVMVRQQRPGSTSKVELATDLLRQTRVGDWLVEKLKPMLIRAPEAAQSEADGAAGAVAGAPESPLDAQVAPSHAKLAHKPRLLDIHTEAGDGSLSYGRWYRALHHPGMFLSVLAPAAVDAAILASYPDRVDPIGTETSGSQENGSVAYMLAIDMGQYGFGYAIGADHPSVGWSPKAKQAPGLDVLPGPDGFAARAPLVTIGALPPYLADMVAGAFVGGFKREHGAFPTGDLAKVNQGSHFGFVENGVVLSRLNPGLATAVIAPDGTMDLLTWPENGDKDFRYVLHARQNGVPIVDGIDPQGMSIPGLLVNRPVEGAWSGNANGRLLTIRGGMGIQEHDGHRFLLVGYFTGATPNAMARIYQAYHCRYAMALDMNAPELCYTALYRRGDDGKITEADYLIKEMRPPNGSKHLRFLQTNDTRDCFYLYNR